MPALIYGPEDLLTLSALATHLQVSTTAARSFADRHRLWIGGPRMRRVRVGDVREALRADALGSSTGRPARQAQEQTGGLTPIPLDEEAA